jgi:cell division protein FtsL
VLLILVIACALGVVTSQHKARKLYVELQKEKDRAQQMDVEWWQLQLEQGMLAMPARVEKLASRQMQMLVPQPGQIRYIRQGAGTVMHP